jgi:hypothetical protein
VGFAKISTRAINSLPQFIGDKSALTRAGRFLTIIQAMGRTTAVHLSVITLVLSLGGCTQPTLPNPIPAAQPVALQLQKQDDNLQKQRYRTLLDFENEADFVFVSSASATAAWRAHTGQGAASVDGAVTVKLQSLLMGAPLPGNWTTVAAYVQPGEDDVFAVDLLDNEKVVAQARIAAQAGEWNSIWLDLTHPAVASAVGSASRLNLRITSERGKAFLLDDVLLIDNARTLVDNTSQGGWKVSRRGSAIVFDSPGRFNVVVQSRQGVDADWTLQECNATRAVLRSSGPVRVWTLYADGRSIQDGVMRVAGALPPALVESHQSPAELSVEESTGRLDRYTPGDTTNSGYNPLLGAYQLIAAGPRLQFTIVAEKLPVILPIFEIKGLSKGKVTAVIDGRLIDALERLEDGRVLLRLPLKVEERATMSVSVTPDNSAD